MGFHNQPQPAGVIPVRIGLAVEVDVLQIAVGVVEIERGAIPQRPGIVDRTADSHLRLLGQPVADASLGATLEVIGQVRGLNDDRAADGIAAVQGALRTLEHLDLLDVVQFLIELVRIGLQHAVDQHGDRGLAVARLRDAADGDEGVADVLHLDQGHVRHHGDEVARRFDARRLDRLLGEGVLRHRHVLQRFVALARRDDDLFELLGFRREDRLGGQDGGHGGHDQWGESTALEYS